MNIIHVEGRYLKFARMSVLIAGFMDSEWRSRKGRSREKIENVNNICF